MRVSRAGLRGSGDRSSGLPLSNATGDPLATSARPGRRRTVRGAQARATVCTPGTSGAVGPTTVVGVSGLPGSGTDRQALTGGRTPGRQGGYPSLLFLKSSCMTRPSPPEITPTRSLSPFSHHCLPFLDRYLDEPRPPPFVPLWSKGTRYSFPSRISFLG